MPPLPPDAVPLGWSRRIGLFALFLCSCRRSGPQSPCSPARRGKAPIVRTAAVMFGVLGIVLPAVFMVVASRQRLRTLGQDERRGLLVLVPGVNLVLWAQLMMSRGSGDEPEPRRWTPVRPPPDTQPRR